MTKSSNVWPAISHTLPEEMKKTLPPNIAASFEEMAKRFGWQIRPSASELAQEYGMPVKEMNDELKTGIETVGEAIRSALLHYLDAIHTKSTFTIEAGMFNEATASAKELIESYVAYHEGKPRAKWHKNFARGVDIAIEVELPEFERQLGELRVKLAPIKKKEDEEMAPRIQLASA